MTIMTEAARVAFGWPRDQRHAPQSPDEEKGGFRAACRCGWPGRWVKASPSHAYQVTRIHAETENAREAAGGALIDPAEYSRDGQPPRTARPAPSPRPSVPSSRPSRGGPGTPCGCGCGESSGGLFRPGHDSKLLSRLMAEIRSGTKTLAQAHEEMTQIGTSEVLRDKLAKKVAQ